MNTMKSFDLENESSSIKEQSDSIWSEKDAKKSYRQIDVVLKHRH